MAIFPSIFSNCDKRSFICLIYSFGNSFIIFPVKLLTSSITFSSIFFSKLLRSNSSTLEILSITFFNCAIAASDPSLTSFKASVFPFS